MTARFANAPDSRFISAVAAEACRWADVYKGAQDLAQNLAMHASAALGRGVADAVEVLLVNVAARAVTQ